MNSKIAILGGAGFLGTRFANRLEQSTYDFGIYDIDISDAFDIISKNPKYAIIEKKDNYFTCVPLHRIKTKFSVKLNCYFYYI